MLPDVGRQATLLWFRRLLRPPAPLYITCISGDAAVRGWGSPTWETRAVTGLPPAGWYDDPEQPEQLRYWSGSAWSEHRAPKQPAAPTSSSALSDIGSWLGQTFELPVRRWQPILALSRECRPRLVDHVPARADLGRPLLHRWRMGRGHRRQDPDIGGDRAGRAARVDRPLSGPGSGRARRSSRCASIARRRARRCGPCTPSYHRLGPGPDPRHDRPDRDHRDPRRARYCARRRGRDRGLRGG